MSLPNALAFCASSPRSQRIRVTIGSRPGALAWILEYRARWRISPNFFRYLQLAQWRKPAASPIAETELGGGDGINRHDIAAVEKSELLFASADDNVMLGVRRCAGCE